MPKIHLQNYTLDLLCQHQSSIQEKPIRILIVADMSTGGTPVVG